MSCLSHLMKFLLEKTKKGAIFVSAQETQVRQALVDLFSRSKTGLVYLRDWAAKWGSCACRHLRPWIQSFKWRTNLTFSRQFTFYSQLARSFCLIVSDNLLGSLVEYLDVWLVRSDVPRVFIGGQVKRITLTAKTSVHGAGATPLHRWHRQLINRISCHWTGNK